MGGGSQRLLCLNPTTVMVVLLLGLWLLLGCDNKAKVLNRKSQNFVDAASVFHKIYISLDIHYKS